MNPPSCHDQPVNCMEDLLHVHHSLRRGLQKPRIKPCCQLLPLLWAHHAVCKVALVPHHDGGEILARLHPRDLRPHVREVIVGGLRDDGIDQGEPFPILHVQVPYGCEAFSSCGVQDLQEHRDAVHFRHLTVGLFNAGVISFYKNTLDILNGKS
uniref:Uncharacterized protein n=1 Tax=Arcella intermedia TaxID=1963864 RepID=A0A6B2LKR6_9EUKA